MSSLKSRTPWIIRRGGIAAPAALTAPTTIVWKLGFVSFLQKNYAHQRLFDGPSIFISMNSFARVLNRIVRLSPSTASRTRAMHRAIWLERDGWRCRKRWYHPSVRIRIGVLRVGMEHSAATASIELALAMVSLRPTGVPQRYIAVIHTRSRSNSSGITVFDPGRNGPL
ncbi:hypothetical protein JG687_00005195 [Phytophthora cactorum]|uniref:Uncharacterized protein n=1 Tax=Phytophthora cactorum TaxID=29920 RepID=A0A8T1UMY8_9STRA|nr:hypothetical protein JG687_00005195 [Phytophthora cactorum]